jgi:hypothetical protein
MATMWTIAHKLAGEKMIGKIRGHYTPFMTFATLPARLDWGAKLIRSVERRRAEG